MDMATSEVRARTRPDIEHWLQAKIAAVLKLELLEVPLDRPFADFGLDSSVIVTLSGELARWLGHELTVTIFWEYPTITEMAESLSTHPTPAAWDPLS